MYPYPCCIGTELSITCREAKNLYMFKFNHMPQFRNSKRENKTNVNPVSDYKEYFVLLGQDL
jgi:hypothetical protein